jgi:high-affinity nickel permease
LAIHDQPGSQVMCDGYAGLPFYAILSLPILFAAGTSLLDTIDGSFMNRA